MKRFTFRKSERLVHLTDIDLLFKEGKAFNCSPLRILYTPNAAGKFQVIITVPRKKFRRAVDRNLIKRKIREAYRLNKEILNPVSSSNSLNVAFIFTGDNKKVEFNEIQQAMISSMNRLVKLISETVRIDTEN